MNAQAEINKKRSKEAIMSGYVRYRPTNKTFYLMINSRNFAKKILSKGQAKAFVYRNEGIFEIYKKEKEGNILKPRYKESVICISGNKLLTKKEKSFLQQSGTKLSFPVKVKINTKQFGLTKYDLYPDKDSAQLAFELEKKGVLIPDRIMTPYASHFDITGVYNKSRIIIEITQLAPSSKNKTSNLRHQPIGGNIRAHTFDVYSTCVNNYLENEKNTYGILLINKKWEQYKHIKEMEINCKKVNCYILYTDFDIDWADRISNRILEILKK